jgi:hypothetical protein
MTKAVSKKKRKSSRRKVATKRVLTAHGKEVQEGLQLTYVINGNLARARRHYLLIGEMLSDVEDRKVYLVLGHPDMGDYAEKRLTLGRASLFRYLQVYDWAKKFHPEWIHAKSGVKIPDLSDVTDLIWVEEELRRKDLSAERRAQLEALQKKGLEGKLKHKDVTALRKRTNGVSAGLKSFLSKLRFLRKTGVALANMPPEVINYLDSAIEVLSHEDAMKLAGITVIDKYIADRHQQFIA